MTILSSKSFTVVNDRTRRAKGPLVRVEIEPGRYVKMHREDAEALAGEQKTRPADENKLRLPEEEKQEQAPAAVDPDDFTEIPGVGPATARALAASGILTFDQLRTADLSRVVSGKPREAIEEWRNG